MRKVSIEAIAGLLALALAATAGGQQPSEPKALPPKAEAAKPATKSKLEELLAQALQNNADIRVAAAKLNEAEAELQRTRLEVLQKVVKAYHAVEVAQANVGRWQAEYRRLEREVKNGVVDAQVLKESENQLTVAKTQLAAAEAELPFLLGKGPAESRTTRPANDAFREAQSNLEMLEERAEWSKRMARRGYMTQAQAEADYGRFLEALAMMQSKPAPGPMADKIRKALDRPITLAFEGPLRAILDDILKAAPGLVIQVPDKDILSARVAVKLENVPLGAALQWLEDALPGYQVVVRDYGLLLAPKGSLPRGALLLNDFWKDGSTGAARGGDKNPPPENVDGVVKSVDPSGGLVTITIGSDAGLHKGHTLEVFHLDKDPKQSKYLGTIRILEVTAKEAVGQVVGRATAPLQTGDRVASKLLGQ
jgi:hypothetical protein